MAHADATQAGYTRTDKDVIAEERKRIDGARQGSDAAVPGYAGLAISGGGIRSAAFATGVLQGLVAGRLLAKMDYLSTVSGGGYIGSSLTWYLSRGLPGDGAAGTGHGNFPYGAGDIGNQTGPRRPALDYVRDHGCYLTPSNKLNLASAVAVVGRGAFLSLLAYLLMVVAVMGLLHLAHAFANLPADGLAGIPMNAPWWGALLIVGVMAVANIMFSLATWAPALRPEVQYPGTIRKQQWLGVGLVAAAILFVVGTLPHVGGWLSATWAKASAAGLSTLSGAAVSLYQLQRKSPGSGTTGVAVGVATGAFLLIYGLLYSGFLLGGLMEAWWQLGAVAAAALMLGTYVNVNYVGMHRMYRNRLMEVFMPDAENVLAGHWGPAVDADRAMLETFCSGDAARPYHLINTNVVLVDSDQPKFRGRGGDSFILSPLYCGSDATGWRATQTYMKNGWLIFAQRGMTLATAMAISGAAANPHTGVAGQGVTRSTLVSALMTLLNVQLGYWAPHPERKHARTLPPNFIAPGLRAGLLGRGLKESARTIQLSDGGHFENLGVYELLRRRVRVIVASDAGADPEFAFGDLSNALERARVDFGTEVEFLPDYPLEAVRPANPGKQTGGQGIPLAARGFAVADIMYNNGPGRTPDKGLLIYIKSTLTDRLPEDVYGYRIAHPDFPHQPTLDQFFDEAQFEAYRELGFHLTLELVKENITRQWI